MDILPTTTNTPGELKRLPSACNEISNKHLAIPSEKSYLQFSNSKIARAINVQNAVTPRPKMPSWEELQARVSKPLVYPMFVVRPLEPRNRALEDLFIHEPRLIHMNRKTMLDVFRYLTINDILVAMRVCRAWSKWAINPSLWTTIRINHKKIKPLHLMGVVRRQPRILDLNWAKIQKEHLLWLLKRLPQLCKLHLQGQPWEVVKQLNSTYCPPLEMLDISFTEDLTDATLISLLSPPECVRSFHADLTTRLASLAELRLAGTRIGDDGVYRITKFLPSLTYLDVSSCLNLTDVSVAFLSHPQGPFCCKLSSLDMRGCNRLTFAVFGYLEDLKSLQSLALYPCIGLPLKLIHYWGRRKGYTLAADKKLERIIIVEEDKEKPSLVHRKANFKRKYPTTKVPLSQPLTDQVQ
ncbi:F-box/LRR-repeat protein 19-like [Palaemon carinicauda]|uniref:F-box/LRR-repeat protein 19-like n=1 Tax=Palaemon carinicauda TaxID=392227 RepID=UPI0035B68EDB